MFVESMSDKWENIFHEFCSLNKESSKLWVSLEGLEQKVKDGIDAHVDQV